MLQWAQKQRVWPIASPLLRRGPLVIIFSAIITSHQKKKCNGLKQHRLPVSLILHALRSLPNRGGFSIQILPAWHKDVFSCSWGSHLSTEPKHHFLLTSSACLSFPCCGSTRVPVPLAVTQRADATVVRARWPVWVMLMARTSAAFLSARAHLSAHSCDTERGLFHGALVKRSGPRGDSSCF